MCNNLDKMGNELTDPDRIESIAVIGNFCTSIVYEVHFPLSLTYSHMKAKYKTT